MGAVLIFPVGGHGSVRNADRVSSEQAHVTGDPVAGDGMGFSRAGLETGLPYYVGACSGTAAAGAYRIGVSIHAAARIENGCGPAGGAAAGPLAASQPGRSTEACGSWISIGEATAYVAVRSSDHSGKKI